MMGKSSLLILLILLSYFDVKAQLNLEVGAKYIVHQYSGASVEGILIEKDEKSIKIQKANSTIIEIDNINVKSTIHYVPFSQKMENAFSTKSSSINSADIDSLKSTLSSSAIPISKNHIYYRSHSFIFHELYAGITDNFSVGIGTLLFFGPLYLKPKFSYTVSPKIHLGLSGLYLGQPSFKEESPRFSLTKLQLTLGSLKNNVTLEVGNLSYSYYKIIESVNTNGFTSPTYRLLTSYKGLQYFGFSCRKNLGKFLYFEGEAGYASARNQLTSSSNFLSLGIAYIKGKKAYRFSLISVNSASINNNLQGITLPNLTISQVF